MSGPKIYAGVSSKARLVSKIYVGVSSKARRVTKAYVGVSGKARLVYQSDFWSAGGIAAANCLAAYQFKGAASETEARKDLTGHGYTLTKGSQTYGDTTYSPTWAAASGYTFARVWNGLCGYLNNSSLNGKDIKCVIVRYRGLSHSNRGYLVTAGGSSGNAYVYCATSYYKNAYVNRTGPGYLISSTSVAYYGTAKYSGVIGANFGSSGALYLDGTKVTTSSETGISAEPGGHTFGNKHADKSDLNNAYFSSKIIIAAAFYSVALTAAQHKAVSDAMLKL